MRSRSPPSPAAPPPFLELDTAAGPHHVGAISGLDRPLGVLLDEEDGATLLVELAKDLEHPVDHQGSEPERRLVEEQEPRSGDEPASDRELLLLSARELGARAVPGLRQDREALARFDVFRHRGAIAARLGADPDVLADREPGEDPPALGHQRDPHPKYLVGGAAREVGAIEHDPARSRPLDPDDRQGAGLARPVAAHESDEFASSTWSERPFTARTRP